MSLCSQIWVVPCRRHYGNQHDGAPVGHGVNGEAFDCSALSSSVGMMTVKSWGPEPEMDIRIEAVAG